MTCATVKSSFYDVTANFNQLNSAVDWNQFSVVWSGESQVLESVSFNGRYRTKPESRFYTFRDSVLKRKQPLQIF